MPALRRLAFSSMLKPGCPSSSLRRAHSRAVPQLTCGKLQQQQQPPPRTSRRRQRLRRSSAIPAARLSSPARSPQAVAGRGRTADSRFSCQAVKQACRAASGPSGPSSTPGDSGASIATGLAGSSLRQLRGGMQMGCKACCMLCSRSGPPCCRRPSLPPRTARPVWQAVGQH